MTCATLYAQSARERVAAQITHQVSQLGASAQVGLRVLDVSDGTVWYAHQESLPLKPASVMKLFVMAAAIEHLGPDFEFTTEVFTSDGELWVVGGGDPGLGDARLAERHGVQLMDVFDEWTQRLRDGGIQSVKQIVIDDSIFDRRFRHEDWPADQSQRWYQAPVGGLNFNDNCLDIRIAVRDSRIELELVPPLPDSFVDNRLALGGKHRPLIKRLRESDVFILTGPVARDAQLEPISARRPSVFVGHALRQALIARHVRVERGVVRRALSPEMLAGAAKVATRKTPLSDVLWRAGVFSQNLFAECLLKALAAYQRGGARSGVAGSWPQGLSVLRETLEGMGLDLSGAILRDGSGLSHGDRVTAAQVAALLRIMHQHPHARLLRDNLARPGKSGSLRRRFREPLFRGRLWAKTGTIRDVSALAGYVERPDATTLAFAILVNGNTKHARQFEDAIVRILIGQSADRGGGG